MQRTVILMATLLVPSHAFATAPDLCTKEVILNEQNEPLEDSVGTTLSVFCEWTGPGASVWAGDVCCTFDTAGASCVEPSVDNLCAADTERYYCKYGEVIEGGGVVCQQPFPHACESGHCQPPGVQAPTGTTEETICCIGGICVPWTKDADQCAGVYMWCWDGYSKVDGTVECFD